MRLQPQREPALGDAARLTGTGPQLAYELEAAGVPDWWNPVTIGIVEMSQGVSLGALQFVVGRTDFAKGAGPLPLLTFALDLRALLTALQPEDHARLLLGSAPAAHFVRIGDVVRITGGVDERTEMFAHDEGLEAARAFLGGLARDLLGRYPTLLENAELARLTTSVRSDAGR